MKRFWFSLAAAALAVTPVKAADPVTVGLVMSFSGWFQPIDGSSVKGAKMAVDEVHAASGVAGRPLSVVQFDNKSDPQLGADGATDVLSKGAKMILLPSDFD